MYGETLPNQDGAPVRMVIPWKYGFKSIKSIVKIKFVKDQPPTTWNITDAQRIRLLFQRESECGSSALEPGQGAPPAARFFKRDTDADVQRLRRPGGEPLQRHGPEEKLLSGIHAMNSLLTSKWTKVVVFLLCLVPLGVLIWRGLHQRLGRQSRRVHRARHRRLDAAVSGHHSCHHAASQTSAACRNLIRFRRMLGLFAFFYGCLHFCTYLTLDQSFDLAEMLDGRAEAAVTSRWDFTAFVLMIPLAITSTAGWIRRLGGKRWQMLHRAIYLRPSPA